ncbi:response regulator, partial [Rhodanobacter sp. OR444]|uniref:response regulator n=2 Tax=Rhodanobacteraceae TaxID=1775411 RepID=UPI001C8291CE
ASMPSPCPRRGRPERLKKSQPLSAASASGGFMNIEGELMVAACRSGLRGSAGSHLAMVGDYGAIVLDMLLPGLAGVELCRKLRKDAGIVTPVLMLSVRGSTDDRIDGLWIGADDCLARPFAARELLARLSVLIRRDRRQVSAEVPIVNDLGPEVRILRATRAGCALNLSPSASSC